MKRSLRRVAMDVSPRNLVHHELIGLEVKVVSSSHSGYVGMAGRVLDETMNMLYIETPRGIRAVPKETSTFLFTLPTGEHVEVEGWAIRARPEDRIKRRVKKARRK
ncbi:MAG: ribonuclease P protein component 1 [Candidatus Nezhaarchaeota archaeon]|nr:ribonuclease P protein component 1 [Candidatus Nezhaarchaeota archaeon]